MNRSYKRLPRSAFSPLLITARLRCGVVSDGFLPIDSILYFAQHRMALGPQLVTLPRQMVSVGEGAGALPLERCEEHGPHWYYAASFARWPEHVAHGVDHWTKRLDGQYVDLMERLSAKVTTGSGSYRGYRMPVAYRHALSISWCVRGEPERIRKLLGLMTHLGKKADQGWGAVIEWTVEPAAEDWSVHDASGAPTRAIPGDGAMLYGFRPPYWLPRNQARCVMPQIAWTTMTAGRELGIPLAESARSRPSGIPERTLRLYDQDSERLIRRKK